MRHQSQCGHLAGEEVIVQPTQRGSVLYYSVHGLHTTEGDKPALESLSGCTCSYSFWLETKRALEKGGGAYAKLGPVSLFAGS
jgi:hypothetical protein